MKARLTIYEDQDAVEVSSIAELDEVIDSAAKHARSEGRANIIFVETANGNNLSVVVGADETVIGFTYGHQDPPYFVSLGTADSEEPIFTAYVSLNHHTEYPRSWVIPLDEGRQAIYEFVESADLPSCLKWEAL